MKSLVVGTAILFIIALAGCTGDGSKANVTSTAVAVAIEATVNTQAAERAQAEANQTTIAKGVEATIQAAITGTPTTAPTLTPTHTPKPTATATPTPRPTTKPTPFVRKNWNIYTFIDGGGSICYPPGWSIKDESLSSVTLSVDENTIFTISLFPRLPQGTDDEGKIRYLKRLVLNSFSDLDTITFAQERFIEDFDYRPALVTATVKDYVYEDISMDRGHICPRWRSNSRTEFRSYLLTYHNYR